LVSYHLCFPCLVSLAVVVNKNWFRIWPVWRPFVLFYFRKMKRTIYKRPSGNWLQCLILTVMVKWRMRILLCTRGIWSRRSRLGELTFVSKYFVCIFINTTFLFTSAVQCLLSSQILSLISCMFFWCFVLFFSCSVFNFVYLVCHY